MKQITKIDDLVEYTKLYLVDTKDGARIATWTPKYGNDFITKHGDVINYYDAEYIVELCYEK